MIVTIACAVFPAFVPTFATPVPDLAPSVAMQAISDAVVLAEFSWVRAMSR
jgi:hypothetical protein